jgi:glucokinase
VGRVVIGVDLGGTNLRTALMSREGDILDRRKEATHASDGWKKVVARLVENIARQREVATERGLTVTAVGVGAPGVIRMDRGIVVKSPNFPDWNNLPLKDELEGALQVPVVIENDANAAALGEQWRGAGKGINSMILLTLGTGVGGGIVLNNQIWQGADGMAGEIGHMTLIPDGRHAAAAYRLSECMLPPGTVRIMRHWGCQEPPGSGDDLCPVAIAREGVRGRVMKDMAVCSASASRT